DDNVLVEEFIKGQEATCGVLENFRGKKHYVLPPIEIIPKNSDSLFNYQAKYDGSSQELCPANFNLETKREIEEVAVKAHQILGCRHYSRSDMIVSPHGIYLLEINTLPGLTSESLIPKSAEAIGLSFPALLDHLIQLALNK
ncbi:MAG: ATP-grasp domain-containing protein, partial [Patescibacteria group bacterium]